MSNQVCPECGCDIHDAFDMGGIIYCCETCATNSGYEYGCVDELRQEGGRFRKKGPRRGSSVLLLARP